MATLSISLAQPTPGTWTQADKAEIMTTLETSRNELLGLVSKLSDKQFFYRPTEQAWSANDIVEHLGLIEEGYVREFWWALAQPALPGSYSDSTKGGDDRAKAYATTPEKSKARGTNLPLNRFCTKATCIHIFNTARNQSVDFFTQNAGLNMRRYFIFRKGSSGKRDIRDLHQQALWMIAHTVRHTNQLRQLLTDSKFPKD